MAGRIPAMEKPWKRRLYKPSNGDASAAKELLDHSRLFLKLDLGYLVAAGAVFTGLKLEVNDVLGNFGTFRLLVLAFALLVAMDAANYSGLYASWARLLTKSPENHDAPILRVAPRVQILLHTGFFVGLVGFLSGYAQATFDGMRELEAKARIQLAVDLTIARTGKVPTTLSALPQVPLYQNAIAKIGDNNIRIKATSGTTYVLTFAGEDGVFDTADDDDYTDKESARQLYDAMFKKKRDAEGMKPAP